MDKSIETMIDIAGRWESLDPSKGLKDTTKFIRQGQMDIRFLLDLIESHAQEIDRLTEEVATMTQERDAYQEVHEDKQRLVRKLDVLMNGDNAASQASLCDIVASFPVWLATVTEERDAYKERAKWKHVHDDSLEIELQRQLAERDELIATLKGQLHRV